jgi:signal peptidase II
MLVTVILALGVLVLDQVSKWLTVRYIKPIGSYPIIRDVFHLTYVENRGAAWGIFQNGRWFFVGITAVVCIAIIVFLIREKQIAPLLRVALSILLGGAIGNMIDRILYGYVVDMIHVKCIDYPVFNIADSATVIGTILLAWYILFQSGKTPEAKGQ